MGLQCVNMDILSHMWLHYSYKLYFATIYCTWLEWATYSYSGYWRLQSLHVDILVHIIL